MQTLEEKQKQLSNLSRNREEFESLLNLNVAQEYRKEVCRILDIYKLKLNELEKILKDQKNLIEKATVKYKEIKKLLSQIAKLSYKFEKYEITEFLLEKIKIIESDIIFIIINYAIEEKVSKKHGKHQVDTKIEILQETVDLIKSSKNDYLTIKNKDLLFNPVSYYFYVIININNEISKIKKYLEKKNKGFFVDKKKQEIEKKINQLDKQKEFLSDSIYTFISFTKKGNEDLIISLSNISWDKYDNISETIGETSWCKLSYLDGVLILVTTGERHENINRTIDSLIVRYFDFKEIGYILVGSATYKHKKSRRGKEADSAYKFSEESIYPNLAVEVNLSSGGLDSLEIYKELKTKEVWMWDKKDNLRFYILQDSEYVNLDSSYFLQGVNPKMVKKYVGLIEKNKLQIPLYKKQFISEVISNTPKSSS